MPAVLILFLLLHVIAKREGTQVPAFIDFIPGDEPLLTEILGD